MNIKTNKKMKMKNIMKTNTNMNRNNMYFMNMNKCMTSTLNVLVMYLAM
jgi:hypothetical protein